MNEVRIMIVMPWKMVVGVISEDTNTGAYNVKDAIVFDNAMTNQGVMIPIPNTIGSSEVKAADLIFTTWSIIVKPFKVPEQLLAIYNQLTSSILTPSPRIIH
jgi:hypothetical protein